jgi:hypothetical protein
LRESFGISAAYTVLWRAATEGRIPAIRHGSRWFVLEDDLPSIANTLRADMTTQPASTAPVVLPA